ncbi:hypothetical protein SAMN05421774_101784 [Gemmobacter megaterium]|uniref:Uncharacterized protein n=1 Tax=Gemmobacter megaterium TaxID=1086013 RepID=A0A1N7KZ69_9RHOB|nr:hypothetical protein [Gemmobacter megaterium]GGE04670.1 hypothetical protein GCM10011345_07690 [Gemmobacter megaterium]SIS66875.1 hypothetical protein SAMN05421774_101784 [Gemmobacter megaterium]
MADENLLDFNRRVRRLEKAHLDGYGFEAIGTLGRSHYRAPRRLRLPVMGPVLMLFGLVVVMKGAIQAQLGPDLYQAKVDLLWQGSLLEQLGAVLMQAEPVSTWVASHLGWMT